MSKKPFISVLIAARNEETVIKRLLSSLENLSYPIDKYEVIFGNDHSSDKTGFILDNYAQKHEHWKVIHLIDEPNSTLKGKTRVLNILAKEAKGEYLFFTDADIALPRQWLESMISFFDTTVGVVVGTTSMEGNRFLTISQSLEWLSVLYFNKLMSDLKVETTGMGNNMAVSREAYDAIGGYEKIGFHIVEDYVLYKAIIISGYNFKQTFNIDSHAFTLPPNDFLEQRTRWISGAIKSKSKFVIPALMQAVSLPFYVILAIWNWKIAAIIWLCFLVFSVVAIVQSNKQLGLSISLLWAPIFCIYIPISWGIQFTYYLFKRGKVTWKDRTY